MKWIKIFIILGILVILMIVALFLSKPYEFEPQSDFEQCKLDKWVECGLKLKNDMCYKLESNTNEKWKDCQEITTEQELCWLVGYTYCWDEVKNEDSG